MNTRTLYHSLLGLSAACIAVLGLLLIQSRQRTVALDAKLRAGTSQSIQDGPKSPDEILRAAQQLLAQRSKWSAANIASSIYDVTYVGSKTDGKWVVVAYRFSVKGWCLFYPERTEVHFNKSGKIARYYRASLGG